MRSCTHGRRREGRLGPRGVWINLKKRWSFVRWMTWVLSGTPARGGTIVTQLVSISERGSTEQWQLDSGESGSRLLKSQTMTHDILIIGQ
jgi:hypothetical protein